MYIKLSDIDRVCQMIISKFIDFGVINCGDIAYIYIYIPNLPLEKCAKTSIYHHLSLIFPWIFPLKPAFIDYFPMDFPKEIQPTKGFSGCLGMVNVAVDPMKNGGFLEGYPSWMVY